MLNAEKLSSKFFQMLMDIKKIYHRDAELDEGYYEFDVTPAVQVAYHDRWSLLVMGLYGGNWLVSEMGLTATKVVSLGA